MSKTKKIIISVVAAVLIIIGVYVAYIFSTTYSYEQALNYCLENTQIEAKEFYFCGYEEYDCFLAKGSKDDHQELFRFKQGGLLSFKRYRKAGADGGDNTTVGVLLEFLKDMGKTASPSIQLIVRLANLNLELKKDQGLLLILKPESTKLKTCTLAISPSIKMSQPGIFTVAPAEILTGISRSLVIKQPIGTWNRLKKHWLTTLTLISRSAN